MFFHKRWLQLLWCKLATVVVAVLTVATVVVAVLTVVTVVVAVVVPAGLVRRDIFFLCQHNVSATTKILMYATANACACNSFVFAPMARHNCLGKLSFAFYRLSSSPSSVHTHTCTVSSGYHQPTTRLLHHLSATGDF